MADTFSNREVPVSDLPGVELLGYEPLAPRYAGTITTTWIATILGFTTVAGIINYVSGNELIALFLRPYVVAPYLAILASPLLWARPLVKSKGYALREKDLHFRSGLIWQKTISLPLNRIQHVELESGPLERGFKLATLKFFTARGGSADMKIPGLPFDRASTLRAFVLEKAGVKEAETEDTQAAETGAEDTPHV